MKHINFITLISLLLMIPLHLSAQPEGLRTFYLSPDGDDGNDGTEQSPFATFEHAVDIAEAGDVFVMRGGEYPSSSTITIPTSRSGTSDNMVTVVAYPGENPVLDFSSQPTANNNNGVRLYANYWHIDGITIKNAGHNGIRMDGSHNILERMTAYGCNDTGIHMSGGASHNQVINCDSYHNFNVTGNVGNNADGFGAKFDIGPGNRYYGCRAWENSDDGFDFWETEYSIEVERCWVFGNGDPEVFGNPDGFSGNGQGFKLGGANSPGEHMVTRCLAFDNADKGYDHNNTTGAQTMIHNTAYNNGRNFYFPNEPDQGHHTFQNNISFSSGTIARISGGSVEEGNSWQQGEDITEDMFLSLNTDLAKSPRQPDGSLPDIDLLKLTPGSFLVDGGVDVGEPFSGSAPDIGAYELDGDPSDDATLSDLTTDGATVQGFDPETDWYEVELSYGTTEIPVVDAVTTDNGATTEIEQAESIPGEATVTVTAQDGSTQLTYTISFIELTPEDDATLSELTVDDEPIDGFSSDEMNYEVSLAYGTTEIPQINATANWGEAQVTINQANELPGTATVEVTSEDGSATNTYEVSFILEDPSDDATLSDLAVDGSTVHGFDSDVTNYTIELPEGTTTIPEVTAEANHDEAEVDITQASELPGSATIEVTAQDGSTNTYVATFSFYSPWQIYNGSVQPDQNDPPFATSDWENNPDYSIIADEDECTPNNQLLQLISENPEDKGNWLHELPGGQESITIVARVRALEGDYDNVLVIDMQFAGSRERIYINPDDTYWLRHAGIQDNALPDDAQVTDWNIFRLTKSGDDVSFYFNETEVPVESVTTSTDSDESFFRFGDPFSDQRTGAQIDWVIWDESGAYSPEEGAPIPHELCTETSTEEEEEEEQEQEPYHGAPMAIPGTIQAQDFDLGGQDVAYWDNSEENEGGDYRQDEWVDLEEVEDESGEYNIGWTEEDEWLEYTVDVETAGAYNITYRVASGGDGELALSFDGEQVDQIMIPSTTNDPDEWWTDFTYTDVTTDAVELEEGEQVMRLDIITGGFNINYIVFEPATVTSTEEERTVEIECYPNPSDDAFYIETPGQFDYTISDMTGTTLTKGTANDRVTTGSELPAGAYILQIISGDQSKTVRLIKQ